MSLPAESTEQSRRIAFLAACDESLASGGPVPQSIDRDDAAMLRLLDRLRPPVPFPVVPPSPDGARYELRGLRAEGGVGQVWQAFDTDLGREVALKVLRPERSGDSAFEARFLHEARITSRLQHPGVVPVYDLSSGAAADEEGEPPFYTMRLVPGRTLTEAIQEYHAGRPKSAVARTRLLTAFISVCNTVAYAHARGVIHRDLKPANIALGEFGEVVVLDWGFAKLIDQPDLPAADVELPRHARQTAAGTVVGTPAYMAPEQATGPAGAIGTFTDVYGLGAILYELLTGQPPYPGDDSSEVLRQVRAGPPVAPRAVRPRVPPALEAICLAALAREPRQRYVTATALANDVQHWLADEPVGAYPEPAASRMLRTVRRHPALVAVAAALVLTCLFVAGLGQTLMRQEQIRNAEARAAAATEHANALARAQEMQQEQLYLNRIALAERTLAAYNPSRAIALLAECPENLRNWEWHCLNRLCHTEQRTLRGHTGTVQATAFSPDGALLATAGFDRTIRLWDPSTGEMRAELIGHDAVVYDLAFSPNGRQLASAGWDGTARIWDPVTGKTIHTLKGHGDHVEFVSYSSNGKTLFTLSNDRTLRTWDAEKGVLVRQLTPPWMAWSLCASPDGQLLALGAADGIIHLLDAVTGVERRQLAKHGNPVRAVAFSHDGRLLATGDGDPGRGDAGIIKVWEVATGAEVRHFVGHTDPVVRLAFHINNIRIASAGLDHTVKIWDLVSGSEALTLHGHTDAVRSVAFTPDGRLLASAGNDRIVRIWDASPWNGSKPANERGTYAGHKDRALGVAFHPDGSQFASVGADWMIYQWRRDRPSPNAAISLTEFEKTGDFGDSSDYFSVAYSPDGLRLATANSASTIAIFDSETRQIVQTLRGHNPGPVRGLAYRADGKQLATAGWDRNVGLWGLDANRRKRLLLGHTEPVNSVAYAPNGQWLASASHDQTVRIWDAESGREIKSLLGHAGGVLGVAVCPDGSLLASAGNDGTVRLWDTVEWKLRKTLAGHRSAVRAVVFSPDGKRLASAGHDWTVRIWRTADGEETAVLRGHTDRVHGLAFSPDSRSLASASYDRMIKLWDLAAVRE